MNIHVRQRLIAVRLIVSLAAAIGSAAYAASVAPVEGEHGMVVTAHQLATKVGVDVLKRGGNAVDAAVAVGYAMAVVYPAAGNLGGGGFMTIQFADGRKTFLDFREKAPLAATRDMYLDSSGNVIKGASTKGHLAVGVPGSVAGLEYAREKYGTRSRGALIAPAIGYAEHGFILDDGDIALFVTANADFADDPATAAIFLNHGKPYKTGDRLIQKDLAKTLRLIAQRGPDAFYRGPIADAIAASSAAGKGIITKADLEQYKVRELAPVECDYRGYHIVSAPPPSSGGVVVCEILNVLEGYPLKDLGFRSAQAVHYQIEAMRHAYLDRNTYLGDPDFVKNPTARLLDKGYAEKVRAVIDPAKAGVSRDMKPGVPPHEGSNTTHYSIVDNQGNAVSVTYTLNDWFGAKVTAAKTGILLNDEMDDFTAKLGVPNLYGLVQGEANSITPGKRPLSSMSPTIVSRDGKPVMVIGTPGGSRIITVVVHCILNVVDYGMNIQEAIDAPRFHQQWLPETTNLELFAISPDTRKILVDMGHKFSDPQPPGHAAGILVGAPSLGGKPHGNERFYGANDPRRGTGLALGY
ncbi:MAG TPA: gamma-glutamyltransferase [Casimicrobiaceae bacterium]|nr:gamma-glutamyltransferase [Casimicrobiaceae bacterium]